MPTYRSEAHADDPGSAVSTLTVNKPTGVVDNDILLAGIWTGNVASISTPHAGWKYIGSGSWFGSRNTHFYWKTASSEAADYTWSWSGSDAAAGLILAYQSSDGIDAAVASSDYNGGTNMESASVTTSVPGSLIVAWYLVESATEVISPDTSPIATERIELLQSGFRNVFFYVQEYEKPIPGAQQLTASGWSDIVIILGTFALLPIVANKVAQYPVSSGGRW